MPNGSPRAVTTDELLEQMGWLRGLARRLARDASSADDLTQGTLALALEQRPTAGRPLRPWLANVIHSLARRARRGDLRRLDRERRGARTEVVPPESTLLEQLEEQRRLAGLVARLEEPYRTVILRRYFAGESAAQIARSTGKPAASVRSQIARALARLRELHGREHGGDPKRSLAALGLAAGTGAPWGVPASGFTSGLASLLAMKTSSKIAAAALLPLLLLAGWFGARGLGAFAEPSEPAEPSSAAVLERPGERETVAASAALSPREDPNRTAIAVPEPVAPPPPAVEPVTSVALRVLDEGGRAIPGAVLSFAAENGDLSEIRASEPSDRTGRIELEVPRVARFTGFSGQDWLTRLRLSAPGYATQLFQETVHAGRHTELNERILLRGARISGRVLTASRMPAPDIEVVAMPGGTTQPDTSWSTGIVFRHLGPSDSEALLRVHTDAHGAFELEGVPTQPFHLWFREPNVPWQTSQPFDLDADESRTDVELVFPGLGPNDVISGRILRPDGLPAAGARVRTRLGPFWEETGIEADGTGWFSLVPEDGGAVDMMAFDAGEEFGPSARVSGRRGEAVTLVLAPARRLEVLVVDPESKPISKAWLSLTIDGNGLGSRVQTSDESGRKSILAPAEVFQLRVSAREHETQVLGPFDPLALPEQLTVQLVANRVVEGIVLSAGKPVPGAEVTLMLRVPENFIARFRGFPESSTPQGQRTETDAEGRFRLALDARRGGEWVLLIEKQGYARGEVVLPKEAPDGGDARIEVELTGGGTLEGRVTVAASRVREGIVIACSRFDGRPVLARTNANGSYRIENLRPGPWRVEDRARTPRGDMMSIGSRKDESFEPNVTIVEGGTTRFDFDLRWQESVELAGRLSFDDVPASGWSARVTDGPDSIDPFELAPVTLDAEGFFAAPAQPGGVTLVLEAPVRGDVIRRIERVLRVTADTGPIEWQLETGVLRGSGESPGAKLRAVGELPGCGRFKILFRADDQGHFEVDGIPAGAVELMRFEDGVHGMGWYRRTEIALVPGEVTLME